MEERKKPNFYKWLVFVWAAHKGLKAARLAHALLKARRLKRKKTSEGLIARYDDH